MQTFKEKVVVKKVIDKTLCNCCGEDSIYHETGGGEVDIEWRDNGPFPSSSGHSHYDICQKCFDSIKLPPNESVHKDGVTIVTP